MFMGFDSQMSAVSSSNSYKILFSCLFVSFWSFFCIVMGFFKIFSFSTWATFLAVGRHQTH